MSDTMINTRESGNDASSTGWHDWDRPAVETLIQQLANQNDQTATHLATLLAERDALAELLERILAAHNGFAGRVERLLRQLGLDAGNELLETVLDHATIEVNQLQQQVRASAGEPATC